MSDFDKEAEREKLREKYGEEEEKRAATEQMSELLLKGATMTNAHCTDCGDPIFRYDGQEFCPTCQKPVAREQGEDDADDGHIEVADPSDDATVQFGAGEADGDTAGERADAAAQRADTTAQQADADAAARQADHAGQQADSDTPEQRTADTTDATRSAPTDDAEAAGTDAPGTNARRGIPSADPGRSPAAPSGESTAPERDAPADRQPPAASADAGRRATSDDGVTAELSAAESVLAETVHRFARRAAETDDPRRAREHLGAAREAAEALDAVRF